MAFHVRIKAPYSEADTMATVLLSPNIFSSVNIETCLMPTGYHLGAKHHLQSYVLRGEASRSQAQA